jgi:hypothetical protein
MLLLLALVGTHATLSDRLHEGLSRKEPEAAFVYRVPGTVHCTCSDGRGASPGMVEIVIRAGNGRVESVRPDSPACLHLPQLVDLGEADPADSLALLEGLMDADPKGALAAIASHDGSEPDRFLEGVLARPEGDPLRREAAFWLGTARGERGGQDLATIAPHEPSPSFREHLAFCLYLNSSAPATDALIRLARDDGSPGVRGKALFWLGQKASRRAQETIRAAARSDEDPKVQKAAVFALSQLPKDQGVPLLLEAARENPRPEVRKAAMFWLAQSGDRRALEFFSEVLTGK